MATVLAHAAPPLAHLGGARSRPGFRLGMVGEGGAKFVVAQGSGWMLYAFSLLAAAAAAAMDVPPALLRGAPPLAVLSAGLLVGSVSLFQGDRAARYVWDVRCDARGLDADAARRACLDLLRLRSTATTPAATRLLDAAAAALAADAALLGDRDECSDDERTASDVDLKISPAIEADGGASRRAKARRAVIARALPLVAAPAATAFGAALLHAAEANRTEPRFAPRVRAESVAPSVAVRARRAFRESRPLARVSTH